MKSIIAILLLFFFHRLLFFFLTDQNPAEQQASRWPRLWLPRPWLPWQRWCARRRRSARGNAPCPHCKPCACAWWMTRRSSPSRQVTRTNSKFRCNIFLGRIFLSADDQVMCTYDIKQLALEASRLNNWTHNLFFFLVIENIVLRFMYVFRFKICLRRGLRDVLYVWHASRHEHVVLLSGLALVEML